MIKPQSGVGKKLIINLSSDATLVLPGIGFPGEASVYFRDCSQFVSRGKAIGFEASVGVNIICIIPSFLYIFGAIPVSTGSLVFNF
jgi:hypothetical protein